MIEEKIIYARSNWLIVFLSIIGMGVLTYLGHAWFVWVGFAFIVIVENFNRPDRDIKYKPKFFTSEGGEE